MLTCTALKLGLLLQAGVLYLAIPAHGQDQYRDGDIRLVGGSYQWEGRVEIYLLDTWGTIADSNWTSNDAQVVCRKLGHFIPGARAHSDAYFGEGSGAIHYNRVQCSGLEYNLTDCVTGNSESAPSHSLDVGVKCQPAAEAYREGDIRLVGGAHNWEGRVEIFRSGLWGTISDSSWTDDDATVVCRQLQHSFRRVRAVQCCNKYSFGSGPIQFHDVECSGSEPNITECTYRNITFDNHQHDVGVQCQQGDEVKEGDIRLVEGSYLWQGRVEIFLSGVWGTMTDDYADYREARVVCRQLGYSTYYTDYECCARLGQGSGPIHLTYPSCTGTEFRLTDCDYSNYTDGDSHSEDWSVLCSIDGPKHLDIRLTGTYYSRVDMFLSGLWQPVANTTGTWQLPNSEVVCRELGYSPNGTSLYYPGYATTGINIKRMDNVECTGSEARLSDCDYVIQTVSSNTAVGMRCEPDTCFNGDLRLVGGELGTEGRVEICGSYGRWYTVCGNQWTNRHTAVVCRHLGFSDTIGDSTSGRFGKGTGPILMDFVNCTGSEPRLWPEYNRAQGCRYYTHYYGCSHDDDVGVKCEPARCADDQVKLIGGYAETVGRVEICSNHRWGALSFTYWTAYYNARTTCIELGFGGYSSYRLSFINGGGPRHSKYYRCTGIEQRLSDCANYTDTSVRTQYNNDVGVSCYTAGCTNGEMRLDEGENELEGRLEMCYNSRWGTISSERWTQTNTQVVCNQLGYDTFDKNENSTKIRQSLSRPVYLHNVTCRPSDLSLLECGFTRYTGNINDAQDVIIVCQKPTCEDGDVKLVGGMSKTEGRLEVCFNQRWTTVDGDGWTNSDTEVACRQLGYPTADISYTEDERTRRGQSLPAYLTLVGCYGSEERLIDCAYHDFGSTVSMDVSISCGSGEKEATSAPQLSSASAVSLSIAVICAVAVAILAVVLIAVFILRRRKKNNAPNNGHETTHHSTHDPDAGDGRYSHSGFTKNNEENISEKEKLQMEDVPMENYEEVEGPEQNPIPIPPKPKKAPKKPRAAGQNVSQVRYTRGGPAPTPSTRPPQRGGQHQPRPPSPELIYECPD